jgi:hypothetical protein
MSKEKTPVLSGSIPAFEMMIAAWTKLSSTQPRLKPFIDVALLWAEKYYAKTHRTKAYIIAMCKHRRCVVSYDAKLHLVINPSVRLSWMKKHWSTAHFKAAEKIIMETVI